MTPQDNIRWYWGDLSSSVKVALLAELYEDLTDEQKEDFKKATVSVGAYTDYEGCTYNSCDWGD